MANVSCLVMGPGGADGLLEAFTSSLVELLKLLREKVKKVRIGVKKGENKLKTEEKELKRHFPMAVKEKYNGEYFKSNCQNTIDRESYTVARKGTRGSSKR